MSNEPTVMIEHDELMLGPVRVTFQRTLRIPEVGLHDLPPGLGNFPLRRVEDYADTAPAEWLARGGVMLPVYQREAMWLSFAMVEPGPSRFDFPDFDFPDFVAAGSDPALDAVGAVGPAALQVGVGKVCAISGEPWSEKLTQEPQNYAAIPDQPWLDGINAGDGFVRQFVAVPLGLGTTVEAQVTGEEVHGGVQLRAVGLTDAALKEWEERARLDAGSVNCCMMAAPDESVLEMGLGAGGRMRQEIYADERALSDYDEDRSWRVFVHLCSAAQWTAITGEVPPPTPIDRETYVRYGLQWFDYYDADKDDLAPSEKLSKVKSVGDLLGEDDEPFTPVDPATVVKLKDGRGPVATGTW